MMPSHAIAYLVTFRTYGSWLPGDERGWVQKDDNVFGTPFLPPRRALRETSRATKQPAVALDTSQRKIVAAAIRDACAHRGWTLHASNVRSNHVHLVVSADPKPEYVMRIVKARSTRLLREKKAVAEGAKIWSRHGSTIYLWKEKQVNDACNYVTEYQGDVATHAGPLPAGRGTD